MKIHTAQLKIKGWIVGDKHLKSYGTSKSKCISCGACAYNRLRIVFELEGNEEPFWKIDTVWTKRVSGNMTTRNICWNCILDVFETSREYKSAGKVTKRSNLTCFLCERGLCAVCLAKGIDRKPVSAVGGIWLKNGHDCVAICLHCVKYRCLNIEPAEH